MSTALTISIWVLYLIDLTCSGGEIYYIRVKDFSVFLISICFYFSTALQNKSNMKVFYQPESD